jgi:hypothetical protein
LEWLALRMMADVRDGEKARANVNVNLNVDVDVGFSA